MLFFQNQRKGVTSPRLIVSDDTAFYYLRRHGSSHLLGTNVSENQSKNGPNTRPEENDLDLMFVIETLETPSNRFYLLRAYH